MYRLYQVYLIYEPPCPHCLHAPEDEDHSPNGRLQAQWARWADETTEVYIVVIEPGEFISDDNKIPVPERRKLEITEVRSMPDNKIILTGTKRKRSRQSSRAPHHTS
jgi:hypothetical protein